MMLPEKIYGGGLKLTQLCRLIALSRAQRRSSDPIKLLLQPGASFGHTPSADTSISLTTLQF